MAMAVRMNVVALKTVVRHLMPAKTRSTVVRCARGFSPLRVLMAASRSISMVMGARLNAVTRVTAVKRLMQVKRRSMVALLARLL